jgi:hypothetical protein
MGLVDMWYIEGFDAEETGMQATFDICPMVRKYSTIPCEQLQVIRDITAFQLSKIDRGIVLIFAAWSGHSVIALQRLTESLSRHDLDFLEIKVIDIESMTGQDMNRLFGRVFHGYGEALWIREGKVVAQLEAFEPESGPLILAHTRNLLAERPREPTL